MCFPKYIYNFYNYIIEKHDCSNQDIHALVHFIKTDVVSVIDILNIKQFQKRSPKNVNDFTTDKLYLGKLEEDDDLASIEIFSIGSK